MPLAELARIVYFRGDTLPPDLPRELMQTRHFITKEYPFAFTNGIQASYLEVDVETGLVKLLRHWCVEDCGRVINPLLVDEQVRGGIVQGIGAALYEECPYSADGQLLIGSMADYLVPMAAEMPDIEVGHVETPTRESLLGAKGAGEAGTAGAPAAVMNAINDALRPFGAKVHAQPFTPERILAALGKVGESGSDPAGLTPWRNISVDRLFRHADPLSEKLTIPLARILRTEHLQDRLGVQPRRRSRKAEVSLRARPRPLPRLGHQARLDRVAVDVPAGLNEMRIALHGNGREAATEERPVAALAIVDPLGEAAAEEAHGVRQTPALAEQQQMEVVVEQAIRMQLHTVARHRCGEAIVEDLAVVVAAEHGLAVEAAVHDMLPCALMVLAWGSRHELAALALEPHRCSLRARGVRPCGSDPMAQPLRRPPVSPRRSPLREAHDTSGAHSADRASPRSPRGMSLQPWRWSFTAQSEQL